MLDTDAVVREIPPSAKRVVIAYSGGVDSHVLLHILATARDAPAATGRVAERSVAAPLHALHINHQTSPHAEQWQRHCQSVCDSLAVDFTAVSVSVAQVSGFEQQAREARYGAFAEFLCPDDVLLLAHHFDDQLETALFRLLRGNGLSGMPARRPLGRGALIRPLLGVSQDQVMAYARDARLSWVSDESNEDLSHDRNYIRHVMLPALAQRWPDVGRRLAASLEWHQDSQRVLEALADEDLAHCLRGEVLRLDQWLGLESSRRMRVLRRWFARSNIVQPRDSQLEMIVQSLIDAPREPHRFLWKDIEMRSYSGDLDLVPADGDEPAPAIGTPRSFMPGRTMAIPGSGELSSEIVEGRGIRAGVPLDIRFRAGGEKIGSKRLRKQFQELRIAPWDRPRIPLLFRGDDLVGVPGGPHWDMRVSPAARAGPGEVGWTARWRPPGG